MALSERVDKIAKRVLKGEIVEDISVDREGNLLATDPNWRKKVKSVGMRIALGEKLIEVIARALEDEGEIRIYFVDDRQKGEKDDWVVLVSIMDPDGAIFIGITPGTLAETKTTNNLIRYLQELLASVRPNGRPFGVQPSLN